MAELVERRSPPAGGIRGEDWIESSERAPAATTRWNSTRRQPSPCTAARLVEDEGDEGRVRAAAEVGGGEVLRGGWRRRGGSASGKRGWERKKERKEAGGGGGGTRRRKRKVPPPTGGQAP